MQEMQKAMEAMQDRIQTLPEPRVRKSALIADISADDSYTTRTRACDITSQVDEEEYAEDYDYDEEEYEDDPEEDIADSNVKLVTKQTDMSSKGQAELDAETIALETKADAITTALEKHKELAALIKERDGRLMETGKTG